MITTLESTMKRLLVLTLLIMSACGEAAVIEPAAIPPGTTIVMTASIAQGPCLDSDIALFTPSDATVTITPATIVTTWVTTANIPTNVAVQFNLILTAATPCLITGTGVSVTINGAPFNPITVTAAATGKNLTVTFSRRPRCRPRPPRRRPRPPRRPRPRRP